MTSDKNMPILVVDDYNTMRRIVKYLLKQLDFTNVEEAASGAEALEKLKEKPFKLIFSDWNMEPTTGLELLRTVRADVSHKNTPFLMMVSDSSKTDLIEAIKKFPQATYIVKPFNVVMLKKRLDYLFEPTATAA